jgi:hypothetical protein
MDIEIVFIGILVTGCLMLTGFLVSKKGIAKGQEIKYREDKGGLTKDKTLKFGDEKYVYNKDELILLCREFYKSKLLNPPKGMKLPSKKYKKVLSSFEAKTIELIRNGEIKSFSSLHKAIHIAFEQFYKLTKISLHSEYLDKGL